MLQEMDAQHGLDCERCSAALGAARRCVRGNQRHQFRPWHHQVHLIEELALARPLGLALEAGRAKAHLFHADTVSHLPVNDGVVQTFPNLYREFSEGKFSVNGENGAGTLGVPVSTISNYLIKTVTIGFLMKGHLPQVNSKTWLIRIKLTLLA